MPTVALTSLPTLETCRRPARMVCRPFWPSHVRHWTAEVRPTSEGHAKTRHPHSLPYNSISQFKRDRVLQASTPSGSRLSCSAHSYTITHSSSHFLGPRESAEGPTCRICNTSSHLEVGGDPSFLFHISNRPSIRKTPGQFPQDWVPHKRSWC